MNLNFKETISAETISKIKNLNQLKMKKLLMLCVCLFGFQISQAQSIFDKFDNQADVTAIVVTNKMFDLMSKVKVDIKEKEAQQFAKLIKKLDNLKVFTTANNRTTAEMRNTVDKYLKTAALEELMRVSDKGKSIKIFVKSGATESQIKELLMFIEGSGKGNETVLMSLTGLFDLDELSALTSKMNLPGGEVLEKASKK